MSNVRKWMKKLLGTHWENLGILRRKNDIFTQWLCFEIHVWFFPALLWISPSSQKDLSLNSTCNSHQVRGLIATSKSSSFHTSPYISKRPSHCSLIHSSIHWSTSVRHWLTHKCLMNSVLPCHSCYGVLFPPPPPPAHLDFKEHDTTTIFILLSCMFLSLWKCSWPCRVSIGIF